MREHVRGNVLQRNFAFSGCEKLKFFLARRGSASRPARPRRLEAGAAKRLQNLPLCKWCFSWYLHRYISLEAYHILMPYTALAWEKG